MHFARAVRRIKKERNQLKILVLGLDNAGKTSVLHCLFGKPVVDVMPTFGYQIHSGVYRGYELILLDIGGQSVFLEYWSSYYEDVDGVVFVFDSTDCRSFAEHVSQIKSSLVNKPMLLLANKCDINPGFSEDVFGNDFQRFLSRKDVRLVRCSARSGEGVNDGFSWLLTESMQRLLNDITNKTC
ncbi:ADP-ribosylation factor-like GTPase [Ordospora colligata]|uniref:ADP-ribosylation factor-like GTPase n=1 Tax=Ordospora colligata OC4 TaxID=1354746 RepID=A0A0B2UM51_9MICR|nr:ADP-ribosylation factor-like GTPase [Ordospora colligata OC4]KHN70137.1 ADP-ribosylation factor-like GTPase [Ordospora colligata OC4]TBU16519.1 ADP-ribosylation factor-like GTPase [Ordospora colligata]TBU16560.1 ADP-ribosylation factor-like GTPase [Ordospora colligata]TBU19133.1 ADP-ribosylation factor-like GTPase [Ordospora colligata]